MSHGQPGTGGGQASDPDLLRRSLLRQDPRGAGTRHPGRRPAAPQLEDGRYAALLDALREACPDAAICVESVLPVGAELDPDGSENDAVRRFNAALVTLAQEKGCDYVDIYAAYEQDGALNPALTRDGIHLNFTAYGPWADCIAQFINADNFK